MASYTISITVKTAQHSRQYLSRFSSASLGKCHGQSLETGQNHNENRRLWILTLSELVSAEKWYSNFTELSDFKVKWPLGQLHNIQSLALLVFWLTDCSSPNTLKVPHNLILWPRIRFNLKHTPVCVTNPGEWLVPQDASIVHYHIYSSKLFQSRLYNLLSIHHTIIVGYSLATYQKQNNLRYRCNPAVLRLHRKTEVGKERESDGGGRGGHKEAVCKKEGEREEVRGQTRNLHANAVAANKHHNALNPPLCRISSTTLSAALLLFPSPWRPPPRSFTTTDAPRSANSRAYALPRPET